MLKSKLLIFISLTCLVSNISAKELDFISGSLSRDLDTATSFKLSLKLKNVLDATTQAAGTEPIHWVQIIITGTEANSNFSVGEECSNTNSKYYMEEINPFVKESGSIEGTSSYTLDLKITECSRNSGALVERLKDKTSLSLDIELSVTEKDEPVKRLNQLITQNIYVITSRPSFAGSVPATGSHKKITVYWNKPDENLATKTTDDKTGSIAANQINIHTISVDSTLTKIPSKKYSPAELSDPKGESCVYDPSKEDCVVCSDDNYPDLDEIKKTADIKTVSRSIKKGELEVSGLENDKDYFVFMTYDSNNTTPSKCIKAKPSENFTLTERNGAGEAKVIDSKCFIASAAYGSPLNKKLVEFRKFRDNTLLDTNIGTIFVKYYYKYSPALADFIRNRPILRKITQYALWLPAQFVMWWNDSKQI